MSKIKDLLDSLRQILSGSDLSDTPLLKKTVTTYTQAVTQLNEQLSHCQNLMDQKLFIDAMRFNKEFDPPLTERAAQLQLPDDLNRKLNEVCALYNYPAPPKLLLRTIENLNHPQPEEQKLNQLVLRWRKLARDGKNVEKINLLRAIINASNGNDQVWRTNLLHVESQWIKELFSDADKALAQKDGAQLLQLYDALTDPELLDPPAADRLKKYIPAIREYQSYEIQQETLSRLNDISTAYSSMDVQELERQLKDYEFFSSNPLYKSSPAIDRQLAEARNFVESQRAMEQKNQEFAEKTAQLIAELDRHGSFEIIENLYEALRQLDLPLDEKLSQRVSNRRDEYLQMSRRKHIRRCIYGFLGAAILMLAGAIALHIYQQRAAYKSHLKTMQEAIRSGNYQAAMNLYDKLQNESPEMLKSGDLSALKVQAEKLQQEKDAGKERFTVLLEDARKVLQKDPPNLRELQAVLKALDKLTPARQEAELLAQYQQIARVCRNLEIETQRNIDQKFLSELQPLLNRLDQALRSIKSGRDLQQTNLQIQQTKEMIDQVIERNSRSVSPDLLKSQQQLLELRLKSINDTLQIQQKHQAIVRKLRTPRSFTEYTETLRTLPAEAPELAGGSYANILRQLPMIQAVSNAATLGSTWSSRENFEQQSAQLPNGGRGTLFTTDIDKLLPPALYQENINQYLDKLKRTLGNQYNCYELQFVDDSDAVWYFYSYQKPYREKRMRSRIPKSLSMDVMLGANVPAQMWPVLIDKNHQDQLVFRPGKLSGLALPNSFKQLRNMKITGTHFPKAEHLAVLQMLTDDLSGVKSPAELEQRLQKILDKLLQADTMNPFAQAILLQHTMQLLTLACNFYEPWSLDCTITLTTLAQRHFDRWYIPTETIEFASVVSELNKYRRNFNFKGMLKYRELEDQLHKLALERCVTPAGVIVKDGSAPARIHWFEGHSQAQEVWFFQADDDDKNNHWMAFSRNELLNKDQLIIPASSNLKYANGTIVFHPYDGRNTAQLAAAARKEAQAVGSKQIVWPASWPKNRR